MFLIKRINYSEEGKSEKVYVSINKKHDATNHEFNQKIPMVDFLGLDKNRIADTIKVEIYMQEAANKLDTENATFIGECFVPWKMCLTEENASNWIESDLFLSDNKG